MGKILVVYELIPEDVEFYLVDTEDQEVIDVLKKCHLNYLNYGCYPDVQVALEKLNLMLGERDELNLSECKKEGYDERFVGLLNGTKIEKSVEPFSFDVPVTVVHTGFAL